MPPKTRVSTRKRRAAPLSTVENIVNAEEDDNDDNVFVKHSSSTKKPKIKEKESSKRKTKDKKADVKRKADIENSEGTIEQDNERIRRLSTVRTHFHREPKDPVVKRTSNNNFLHILDRHRSGLIKRSGDQYIGSAVRPIIENISRYRVSQCMTPWDGARRVTSLAWHPRYPNLAAVGSKHGDIILWDTNSKGSEAHKEVFKSMIEGRGPGGSIQSLKFDINHPEKVYTASIDGTVTRHDFDGLDSKVYLETNDWERWYVGMDVSFSGKMMVAGNNKGTVSLLTLEGEKIWDLRLHKSKCNFVQFSERQPWMMVTCSTGSGAGVKVWDIRNIKGAESSLAELHHDKAVNSAYFSPMSGDKLLTTDQHSQIRVYQAPHFNLLRTIPHPHRQFQHLTPIKACWHPLVDLVFAGRYPDPQFPDYHKGELRTIDFFSPLTGECLYQLQQPGMSGIISLSQFNPVGDRLLSGMGTSVLIWQQGRGREQEDEDETRLESPSSVFSSEIEGKPVSLHYWPDFTSKTKKQTKKKKLEKE